MINMPRYARKCIAALLLLVFTTSTFMPGVAFALTSGPTSPEATSFEPIDTTDMVNLQTGDFTYNMPLLEVPGPEGGYPLSLSYHAGIQPGEEASWVGLGWTLNPGAINRYVSGYADDWYNPTGTSHVYWEGGVTHTYNIGVSIGIANTPANVSFGLSFSEDTYKGFGSGMEFGVGGRLGGKKSPLSGSVTFGVSPDGDNFVKGGIGAASDVASASIGFATNFKSFQAGAAATLGFNGTKLTLDDQGKLSWQALGFSAAVSSSKEAGIQTKTTGLSLDIPTPLGFNISLGYKKSRYWTDETTSTTLHGGLYASGWGEDATYMNVYDNVAYDSYSLLEDPAYKNIIDNPDPQKVQGGAYPDFDIYNVSAQGLGGNMRPYLLQGEVLGQNKKNSSNDPLVTYYSPGVTNYTPRFRFDGDFSNSYRQNYTDYSNPSLNLRVVAPPFDGSPVYGNSDGTYGYDGASGLAGSRHVDVGVKVQPSNILGYVKADRYQSFMIDGFSITNESGVTYHYGLPAYSWGEENYQERMDKTSGLYGGRSKKPTPYAYTWYLTTITGPDFVDRDADGKAGNSDWGYWVNFEYGKWSNNYIWRNPGEGYHRDDDNEWQDCSMGHKEVYYLNAISTRTHVAVFEKEIRYDGWGASPEIFNKNVVSGIEQDYTYSGVFNANGSQSLRLRHIYLYKNGAYQPAINSGSETYVPYGRTISCADCEMPENVVDKSDYDDDPYRNFPFNADSLALRIIDFNYDNSLCSGVTNNRSGVEFGKLTLKSVKLRGKGGVSVFAPTQFDYDLTGGDINSQAGVSLSKTAFTTTNATFKKGDLIRCQNQNFFCGVITNVSESSGTYTYTLKNSEYPYSGTSTENVYTTKNPPFNREAYDIWGLYKSDVNTSGFMYNINQGRQTSFASSQSLDAWSLRKITTGLGATIKINYEPDSYKSVMNNNGAIIANMNLTSLVSFKIFNQNDFDFIYNNVKVGDEISFAVIDAFVDQYTIDDSRDIYPAVHVTSIDAGNNIISTDAPRSSLTVNGGGLTSNLMIGKSVSRKGGGIRTKNISIDNGNVISTISYNYNVPSSTAESGISTYDPVSLDDMDEFSKLLTTEDGIKAYRKVLNKDINRLYTIARELPSPGVMYEYVTVTSQIKNADEEQARDLEGKTQYQFEVFRENMVGRVDIGSRNDNTTSHGRFTTHNVAIKKFKGSIGKLKRVIQFDKNGRKLTETVNHYLHDGLENLALADFMDQYKTRLSQFSYQGYVQERYSEVKTVGEQGYNPSSEVMATLSAREDYPCISTGQTIINFVNGTQTSSENLAYDFYSGALVKSVETDAYGNRFMTETKPAYRVAEYDQMGLKINTSGNKNMLAQRAATYVYKVNSSNTPTGLVSAQVQTWSKTVAAVDQSGASYTQNNLTDGNVWRMQSSYSWQPNTKTSDGLTATGNFSDFNFTNPSSSAAPWKKTSETTLYDVYSHALEEKDINSNYSSIHMNHGNSKVILSGGPASYYEIAYGGVEDDGINQSNDVFVKKGDGVVSGQQAHTGVRSLLLGTGGKGLIYTVNTNKLNTDRDYMVSAWVKPPENTSHDAKLYYEVNGVEKETSLSSINANTKKANGWYLLKLIVKKSDLTSNATLKVGCKNLHTADIYVDDLRFQPVNSSTKAYVYDGFSGELTYVLDNSNLFTKFAYDPAGRLVYTFKEKIGSDLVKLSEIQYNNSPVFSNTNYVFDYIPKNDCAGITPNEEPSSTFISIDYGDIKSLVSVADANAQALAYAQKQANSLGVCWVPSTYARLELVAHSDDASNSTTVNWTTFVDIYIRFYADPACTIPKTTSSSFSFTIRDCGYYETESSYNWACHYEITGTVPSGVNEIYVDYINFEGMFAERDENGDFIWFERYKSDFELQPNGFNFSIKPPSGYPTHVL